MSYLFFLNCCGVKEIENLVICCYRKSPTLHVLFLTRKMWSRIRFVFIYISDLMCYILTPNSFRTFCYLIHTHIFPRSLLPQKLRNSQITSILFFLTSVCTAVWWGCGSSCLRLVSLPVWVDLWVQVWVFPDPEGTVGSGFILPLVWGKWNPAQKAFHASLLMLTNGYGCTFQLRISLVSVMPYLSGVILSVFSRLPLRICFSSQIFDSKILWNFKIFLLPLCVHQRSFLF